MRLELSRQKLLSALNANAHPLHLRVMTVLMSLLCYLINLHLGGRKEGPHVTLLKGHAGIINYYLDVYLPMHFRLLNLTRTGIDTRCTLGYLNPAKFRPHA